MNKEAYCCICTVLFFVCRQSYWGRTNPIIGSISHARGWYAVNWIISLFSLYECAQHRSAVGVIGRQRDMWSPLCQKQWDLRGDAYELAIKLQSGGRGGTEWQREGAVCTNVISPPVGEGMRLVLTPYIPAPHGTLLMMAIAQGLEADCSPAKSGATVALMTTLL